MKKVMILTILAATLLALCCASAMAATQASAWSVLQTALESGGELELAANVTAGAEDTYLIAPSGVTVTLDLKGHTLDRHMTAARESDGHVIQVEGTLTLKDTVGGGKITGGWNTDNVGGIYVNGTLNLLSGEISGTKDISAEESMSAVPVVSA